MSVILNDITIIIPTRTNLAYLQLVVNSIRSKKRYENCEILIGADNPSTEVREWLANNQKGQFDFKIYEPRQGQDRVGIVGMVSNLIEMSKTKFIYYIHDDMVIGEKTIENLLQHWEPKRILSSKRVEPPVYPQTPEKFIQDFGLSPENFDNNGFLEFEKQVVVRDKKKVVEGFFAPHFFAREDWVGYDPVFAPQSREDSDLAQRFIDASCQLYTVWDSLVYHFSGKGSRRRDDQKQASEWEQTNRKNERNYIRKWKTLTHTQFILPKREPSIPISAHVLVGKEEERMYDFLVNVEPFFDEFIFVFDKQNQDDSKTIIEKYMKDQEENGPTNFDPKKFRFFERNLDNDFAAQTNFAIEQCSNEWTMKLDVDEKFPVELLSSLRSLIQNEVKKNPNLCIFGFARLNSLDGKISNDIPREHWFTEEFDKYPQRPTAPLKNPDIQFRLHKRTERWVNPVHEIPQSVAERDTDRFALVLDKMFLHPKNREKQREQEEKYKRIRAQKPKEDVKTFVYDSVIYTIEGITKHAQEEIKELVKRGNKVFLTDLNYRRALDKEGVFCKCYDPVDFEHDNYVTIVNQPPPRWANTKHFKNRIGYVAFEGVPPEDWVKIINESGIKELWTPSTFSKRVAEKGGVIVPVFVIPHGVDLSVWQPRKVTDEDFITFKNDNFLFLAAGTFHNCILEGQQILTSNYQYKEIEDINIGDSLITHTGQNKKVSDVVKTDQNHINNISVIGLGTPIKATDEHRLLTVPFERMYKRKHNRNGKEIFSYHKNPKNDWLEWKQVKELRPNDFLVFPKNHTPPKNIYQIDLSKWFNKNIISKNSTYRSKYSLGVWMPQFIPHNYELGIITGWLASDGCVCNDKSYRKGIRFFQSKNSKKDFNKLKQCLKKLFGSYKEYNSQEIVEVAINDIVLGSFFKDLIGVYSGTKKLSDLSFNNKGFMKGFIEGFWNGDGTITKSGLRVSGYSKKLIYQIKTMMDLLSIPNSIREYTTQSKSGKNITFYDIDYKNSWGKNKTKRNADYLFYRIKNTNREKGQFTCYDITVEDDESFILEGVVSHNSRKGLDLVAKAFSEEFGPSEKVKLVFKVNRIYNPKDTFINYIRPHINPRGNTNIEFIDKDLVEESLVDLFNIADVYISPHRAEGFGINILNAMSVGTPVIVTNATGNTDFCNKNNTQLVDVSHEVYADLHHPYERAMWVEPDLNRLKVQMRKVFNNYEFFRKKAKKNVKFIKDEYTWAHTVDKMQKRLKTIL